MNKYSSILRKAEHGDVQSMEQCAMNLEGTKAEYWLYLAAVGSLHTSYSLAIHNYQVVLDNLISYFRNSRHSPIIRAKARGDVKNFFEINSVLSIKDQGKAAYYLGQYYGLDPQWKSEELKYYHKAAITGDFSSWKILTRQLLEMAQNATDYRLINSICEKTADMLNKRDSLSKEVSCFYERMVQQAKTASMNCVKLNQYSAAKKIVGEFRRFFKGESKIKINGSQQFYNDFIDLQEKILCKECRYLCIPKAEAAFRKGDYNLAIKIYSMGLTFLAKSRESCEQFDEINSMEEELLMRVEKSKCQLLNPYVYALLAILLGFLGLHDNYAKCPNRGRKKRYLVFRSLGLLAPITAIMAIYQATAVNKIRRMTHDDLQKYDGQ